MGLVLEHFSIYCGEQLGRQQTYILLDQLGASSRESPVHWQGRRL